MSPHVSALLVGELQRDRDLVTVKVWRRNGVLAWTNRARNRIGKRFELEGNLEKALGGHTAGSIGNLEEGENAVERSLGFDHLLQVYAPIQGGDGRVVGAYEIYANSAGLESMLSSRRHLCRRRGLPGALDGPCAARPRRLEHAATPDAQLRARSQALLDSYRRLEESALEAIESLNATVEAKDPDTAGHSLRVQRVALALGEELALPPERLDALRYRRWGAMTTDRPYHRALLRQEALAEIRAGRATQFAPEVVDAFFAAAAHRPAEFGLETPPGLALRAV